MWKIQKWKLAMVSAFFCHEIHGFEILVNFTSGEFVQMSNKPLRQDIQYSIFCVWYTWIIHWSFVSNSSRTIYFLLLSLTIFSGSTSRSNKEKMIFHLSGFVYKCTYSQHLQANIYLGKLKPTLSFGCKIQCNTRLLSINKDIRFNWPFGWLAFRFI